MSDNDENVGILYVMSSAVKGLIKIGSTNDFSERMRFFEKNGYCNVTGLKRVFAVKVKNYISKELVIKRLFKSLNIRINGDELYNLDLDLAISLLLSFDGEIIYLDNDIKGNELIKEELFVEESERTERLTIEDLKFVKKKFIYKSKINGSEQIEGKIEIDGGEILLLKGSIISSSCHDISPKYKGTFDHAKRDKNNRLLEDIECRSVSMAACIAYGYPRNGWTSFRDEGNKSLDDYRNNND